MWDTVGSEYVSGFSTKAVAVAVAVVVVDSFFE